jgi:hypothetical protein
LELRLLLFAMRLLPQCLAPAMCGSMATGSQKEAAGCGGMAIGDGLPMQAPIGRTRTMITTPMGGTCMTVIGATTTIATTTGTNTLTTS